MESVYTTEARSTGSARDGRAYLTDRTLEIQMGLVEELGGNGDGANPEQLFALGYATCFHQAVKIVAGNDRADATGSSVQARVHLYMDDDGNYNLAIDIAVSLPFVEMDHAREIAARAHSACPYSRATRGNIDVKVTVVEQ